MILKYVVILKRYIMMFNIINSLKLKINDYKSKKYMVIKGYRKENGLLLYYVSVRVFFEYFPIYNLVLNNCVYGNINANDTYKLMKNHKTNYFQVYSDGTFMSPNYLFEKKFYSSAEDFKNKNIEDFI